MLILLISFLFSENIVGRDARISFIVLSLNSSRSLLILTLWKDTREITEAKFTRGTFGNLMDN